MPDHGPGPRTLAVVAYVTRHPGCSKADACRGAPARYDSVERALWRGLIYATPHRGHYHLYPRTP